tara:strand:+ start:69366 stop:70013 length:648 start_codon:yes stop_codon:yes gene_type:complete
MQEGNDSELKVAEFLLKIKAVKLQPKNPFTWASGIQSPIYCDNRSILSHPSIRTYIRQVLTEKINEQFPKPEIVAGVATGGIAIGALVAQEMGLPFVYVRSSAKGHGMQNLIEGGTIEQGQSVIVIEDLISTGKSSLLAVKALKEAGANVKGLVAIFSYGFEESVKAFADEKVPFHTLTNYNTLVEHAASLDYVSKDEIESLNAWRQDPKNWTND